ncbi:hypothetical protein [Christiangramia flava]|uniref:hypothetical protein n=1 Tax=Christiangramia flava TaxID=1486245 RepID=UPI0009FA9E4F|nr:hypothetical protein [Christiangramia flava]
MKKLILTFVSLFLFILSSCHTPSYTFSTRSSNDPIKFQEGNYLVYTRDIPTRLQKDFEKELLENFSAYVGRNNLKLASETSGLILPARIPISPDKKLLNELKIGAESFDYLINIHTNMASDDIGSMQIGNLSSSDRNSVSVSLEIIDLNVPGSIYIQEVYSVLQAYKDTKDFSFAVTAEKMMDKSFKKILSRIEKNYID